jgi:hypothetical protein
MNIVDLNLVYRTLDYTKTIATMAMLIEMNIQNYQDSIDSTGDTLLDLGIGIA